MLKSIFRLSNWWFLIAFAIALGLTLIVAYSVAYRSWSYFALASLIAGASAFCGGFLGFLFGLPRSTQLDNGIPASSQTTIPNIWTQNTGYAANTNLEEISDWLTKIIVGVTLVQLGPISEMLNDLSDDLGQSLGGIRGTASGDEFALAILLYFFASGFLYAYLWTRILLPRLFVEAEIASKQKILSAKKDELDLRERELEKKRAEVQIMEARVEELGAAIQE